MTLHHFSQKGQDQFGCQNVYTERNRKLVGKKRVEGNYSEATFAEEA